MMEAPGFPGLAALVELPSLAAPVGIRSAFGFLLKALGVPKNTRRAALPNAIPATAATALLQLLSDNFPEDVNLHDVVAALSPAAAAEYGGGAGSAFRASTVSPDIQQVQLDALLGLSCLISSGSTHDKLQLCFWALDRDSSGSLDLQQVLGLVPAARLASAAARVILQEATLQSLAEEAADPQACADSQQGCAVLREVLTCAFLEADPHSTGVIKPGEQLMQLLFVCAAQLTTVMIGGGGSMSRENTAGGAGSSLPSTPSTTTPPGSRLTSPSRLQQQPDKLAAQQQHHQQQTRHPPHLQQQQHADEHAVRAPSRSNNPFAAAAGAAAAAAGAAHPPATLNNITSAMADVVIMDGEGGILHYQAPIEAAAAAACQGMAPTSSSAGVRVYAPTGHGGAAGNGNGRASGSGSGPTGGHQGLAPASSLLQHLEYLEAQQQQQQHPDSATAGPETALFLTPNGTTTAEEDAAAGVGGGNSADGSAMDKQHQQQQQRHRQHEPHEHHRQQQQQQQHHAQLHPGSTNQPDTHSGTKSSPGSSANSSLRRIFVGSPFATITESSHTARGSGTSITVGEMDRKDASSPSADPAAPPTAAGAITHTATNVMTTIQSNILAVAVKLLLQCGVCFLITTMVILADAALVAGLHVGAKLPLSISFAVAVGANLALVVLLLALLIAVRVANEANNSRLAEVANSPEAQQLDQILETMKAAVQALKTSEQKQQHHSISGVGSTSQRFTGSHFLASRASSTRGDLELGRREHGQPVGGPTSAGMMGRAPSGPLPVTGKLRAVWSAVGRVAGFLPPAGGGGPLPLVGDGDSSVGPFGSSVQLEAGGLPAQQQQQHSSTSWGASVSSGHEAGGAASAAGGGGGGGGLLLAGQTAGAGRAHLEPAAAAVSGRPAAVGPGGMTPPANGGGTAGQRGHLVQPSGPLLRSHGTAAPGATPAVALREAYPQL